MEKLWRNLFPERGKTGLEIVLCSNQNKPEGFLDRGIGMHGKAVGKGGFPCAENLFFAVNGAFDFPRFNKEQFNGAMKMGQRSQNFSMLKMKIVFFFCSDFVKAHKDLSFSIV